MQTGISITLKPADRRCLASRRAEIVVLSADGIGTNGIMRQTGSWRHACGVGGNASCRLAMPGLLRDNTRPSRIPHLGSNVAERVVAVPGNQRHGDPGDAIGDQRHRSCAQT